MNLGDKVYTDTGRSGVVVYVASRGVVVREYRTKRGGKSDQYVTFDPWMNTLGRFRFHELKKAIALADEQSVTRRNPEPKVPAWADRMFEEFHWGDPATEVIETEAHTIRRGETLVALGELVEVTYRAKKAGERYDWVHDFSRPRPMLTYQQSGQLVIIGGRYRVTPRGIVG